MAPRFLLISAPTAEIAEGIENRVRRHAALFEVYRSGSVVLLTSIDAEILLLDRDAGFVIGPLFRGTAPAQRVTGLSPAETRAILNSQGQALIDDYWGGYIAVLASTLPGSLMVLRDPSGAMPCYRYPLPDGVTIFVSDVETLWKSGLCQIELNLPALSRLLLAYDFRTEDTCLTGLKEVLAGYRLSISHGVEATDLCWTPSRSAALTDTTDPKILADNLYTTVCGVVRAWGSVFEHPMLGVSGGLDSSVIAAILAARPAPCTLLTMSTDEGDGDERHYTRLLGHGLHTPVLERFHELDQIDIEQSTSGHLPRPMLLAFGQSEHRQKREIARDSEIDAFFSGVGGDNVFCSMSSVLPLIDRLLLRGPTPGLWQTSADLRRLTGCSLPELAHALAKRLARGHDLPWPTDYTYLSPSVREATKPPLKHPWLEGLAHVPPGKRQHIAMLARIQGTVDGYSRFDSPLLVNPLLSQPLMELCLSIPTWAWVADGRDRAVTRRAFSEQLPKALIERRSKGTPNSFAYDVVDRHRETIRAHLLDGVLAANDIVDVAAIEGTLTPGRRLVGFEHMRLATLMEAEVWCRLWKSRRNLQADDNDGFTSDLRPRHLRA